MELGIKSKLEIMVTWEYHCMESHILNGLFATEPSTNWLLSTVGLSTDSYQPLAYQLTYAARHHSVLQDSTGGARRQFAS